jgi:hypothetical protein
VGLLRSQLPEPIELPQPSIRCEQAIEAQSLPQRASSATILRQGATQMANVSSIVKQLKKERDRVQTQLKGIDAALTAFATVYRMPRRARRVMSLTARKKIAAAQRRRWATFRKSKAA